MFNVSKLNGVQFDTIVHFVGKVPEQSEGAIAPAVALSLCASFTKEIMWYDCNVNKEGEENIP